MEQHQVVDGGSFIKIQKHDSRINDGHDLSEGKLSDMAGDARIRETDEMMTTAGSVPSGTKSATSANSSPACQELLRTSVEKFVFEVDKSKLATVGHADPVSHFHVSLLAAHWSRYSTVDAPTLSHPMASGQASSKTCCSASEKVSVTLQMATNFYMYR